MPITADTFRTEHFDHLIRGVEAARGALQLAETARDEARQEANEQRTALSGLEETLSQLPTEDAWNELVELVEDVGRGVHTLDELLAHVRAL